MRKSLLLIVPFILAVSLIIACSDNDEEDMSALTLNFNGLENLGSSYAYEGWIIVGGDPVSTGTFTVDDNGDLSRTSFDVNKSDLDAATKFILTIEPSPDPSPEPSATHYLAGAFDGNSAALTVADSSALQNDFTSATGTFILATPTNGAETDENSGIWFLDLSSGSPAQGLFLPVLPDGWEYEGWAVIDGTPVTSGKFTDPDGPDDADPYSDSEPAPPFPGEDYLMNAPSGLTFPTDLAGGAGVISIEPDPDNSPLPFTLKPLVGAIPSDATDHENYDMVDNTDTFPTGMASR